MSSDNGWILRLRESDNKYILQHYMASADELPDINHAHENFTFDKLDDAVLKFAEMDDTEFPSEYGLTVKLPKEAKTRHCHYQDTPDVCTQLCE